MTKFELSNYLEQQNGIVYKAIEEKYRCFAVFDNDIETLLNTMYHFASDGEFFDLIEFCNKRLFN